MSMEIFYHVGLLGFSTLLVAIVLYAVLKNNNRDQNFRPFILWIVSVIVLNLMDIAKILILDGNELNNGFKFGFAMTLHLLAQFTIYSWFIYAEGALKSKFTNTRKKKILWLIPLSIWIIDMFVNYNNNYQIFLDNGYHFVSIKYNLMHYIVGGGYVLFNFFHTHFKIVRAQDLSKKREYINISTFAIFPLVFGTIQIIVPDTSMLNLGFVVSLIQMYIISQNNLITIDPLTSLNNKRTLLNVLNNRILHIEDESLYLCMLDLDHFKQINDKFGHVEGDEDLKKMAEILKKIGSDNKCFIARFGGDEFNIILSNVEEETVKNLISNLNSELEEYNKDSGKLYKLEASIGYAKYKGEKTVSEFIAKADKELYKIKKAKKSIRA